MPHFLRMQTDFARDESEALTRSKSRTNHCENHFLARFWALHRLHAIPAVTGLAPVSSCISASTAGTPFDGIRVFWVLAYSTRMIIELFDNEFPFSTETRPGI